MSLSTMAAAKTAQLGAIKNVHICIVRCVSKISFRPAEIDGSHVREGLNYSLSVNTTQSLCALTGEALCSSFSGRVFRTVFNSSGQPVRI